LFGGFSFQTNVFAIQARLQAGFDASSAEQLWKLLPSHVFGQQHESATNQNIVPMSIQPAA
jgi:hypothetical protein